jgi:hypothetical protein
MPRRLATPTSLVSGPGRLLEPLRVYLYRAIDQFGQVIDVLVAENGISRPLADSSSRRSTMAHDRPR